MIFSLDTDFSGPATIVLRLTSGFLTEPEFQQISTAESETAGQDFDLLQPPSPTHAPERRPADTNELGRCGHTHEQGTSGWFGVRGRRPAFEDSVNLGLDLRWGLENLQKPVVSRILGLVHSALMGR